MALNQATKDKLKSFHLDVDKLIEAIKADAEVDYVIPEVSAFTPQELTARDEVKVGEGKKEGQRAGETIGKEIAVKELKKQFGVEVDGKDLTKLVDAVKTQLAKGDDGLKQQITLLQKSVEEKESLIEAEKKKAEGALFDASLLSELPANRSQVLTDQEYLLAIKTNLEFGADGVKKGGEVLRDQKTQNPIPRKQAIESYFSERKWVNEQQQQQGGRGGGNNNPPGKAGKLSEVTKAWEAEGKSINTAEFQQHLSGVMKDNPEFSLKD